MITPFRATDEVKSRIDATKELLQQAMDMQFEAVIIHGFKDGNIHTESSGYKSTLELIGSLELAKAHVLAE